MFLPLVLLSTKGGSKIQSCALVAKNIYFSITSFDVYYALKLHNL